MSDEYVIATPSPLKALRVIAAGSTLGLPYEIAANTPERIVFRLAQSGNSVRPIDDALLHVSSSGLVLVVSSGTRDERKALMACIEAILEREGWPRTKFSEL
jgi:hypothetical protein